MRLRKRFSLLLAAMSLAGCATNPTLIEGVSKVRAGVALAGQQSNAALIAANTQARERGLELKVSDPSINLRESDFPLAVAQSDILAWQQAFTALDSYMDALQQLADPGHGAQAANALGGIGTALQNGKLNVSLPAGTAGAFAALGGAIVQARAEHKATEVMRRADPAFNAVMAAMADAIGADDSANLRGTVRANWESSIAHLRVAYAAIPPDQPDARRAVANQFIAMLDQRDATDANLAQLRTSLIALGEAHAAAARGSGGDAQFWVGRMSGWLDDVQHRIDASRQAARISGVTP
jgi:hypothetical protein